MKELLTQYKIDPVRLQFEYKKLAAELSLYEFHKQAWEIIWGNTPLVEGWYLPVMCEHLEAAANRQIKRLIINIIPRIGKSSLGSISFPAWRWVHAPQEKFVYASYSLDLSKEHSAKSRDLIRSDWYQLLFGDRFQLLTDQDEKKFFANNKGGYRIATSVGATTTGRGGSILVLDDPNNMQDVNSAAERNKVNRFEGETWTSRLNDQVNDVKIVIMQRGHTQDVTGFIQEKDIDKEYVLLNIPLEFEYSQKCFSVILPSTNGKVWEDPRKTEGETICPIRFPAKVIRQLKNDVGSYGFAAQYQQRPSPEGGGIIKKEWFKLWKDPIPPNIKYIVQSWDTAFSKKEGASYSACTTWGVFHDQNYVENLILLSLWRGRLEYPELRTRAKRLYFDYRDVEEVTQPHFRGRKLDMCLIEAKASGSALISDLKRAGLHVTRYNPNEEVKGDKINRAHFITPLIEGGIVWLPTQAPGHTIPTPFAEQLLQAAIGFPSLESNDIIDTMTQILGKLKRTSFLRVPTDYYEEEVPKPLPKLYNLS